MTGSSEPGAGSPAGRQFPYEPTSLLNPSGSREPLLRFTYPDGHIGWVVTGQELARAVLADTRFSARAELKRVPVQRPGAESFLGVPTLPGWFIDMDPPEHARYRRLLAGYFTNRKMKSFQPRVESIIRTNLASMERLGCPVDLMAAFARPTAVQVLCELLGVPYDEYNALRSHRETLFSLEASPEDGAHALRTLTDFVASLARQKAGAPGCDLLSGLANDTDLTVDDIAGVGVLMLTAGHDTVASMLATGTTALLLNRGVLHDFDWSDSSVNTLIEELLRYLSIFHLGVPRTSLVDVPLAGKVIQAGEAVTVAIPSANQDLTRYTNPRSLNCARAEGGNVAFGHGIHQCLGQNLARLEMRLCYPALFQRFPGLRLAAPAEDITVTQDGAIYSVRELPVTW
jgi:cytochrome P450